MRRPNVLKGIRSQGRKLWHRYGRFFINIVIGIICTAAVLSVEHTDFEENALNWMVDRLMRLVSRSDSSYFKDKHIVFVEIDDLTRAGWGSPAITPLDKLADIVKTVAENGAKVIVVDVLLDDQESRKPLEIQTMKETLIKLRETNNSVKVILPVLVDQKNGEVSHSLFDGLVDNEYIFQATPYANATEQDLSYRFWCAFNIGHAGDKKKKLIWGVPLLATALFYDDFPELQHLEKQIGETAGTEVVDRKPYDLKFGPHRHIKVALDQEDIYIQRINYEIIPRRNTLNIIKKASNLKIPTDDDGKKEFNSFFKDKIVIIGNAARELGDIHKTPLGDMFGIYILGNATNTVLNGKQPGHLHLIGEIVFDLVAMLFSAYCFWRWEGQKAYYIYFTVFMVFTGFITWELYKAYTVIVNAPFIGLGMLLEKIAHPMVSKIAKVIKNYKTA